MSSGGRIAVLAAIIVVAAVGLVIASGSGDDDKKSDTTSATTSTSAGTSTTTTTTTPTGPPIYTVTVKNAKPVGGVERIKVDKGDQVNLVVKSDTADEIHIHGYDISKKIAAGGTARFRFKAEIDGGFEIELENLGEQIAELQVQP